MLKDNTIKTQSFSISNLFNKITVNLSNTLGPAIICLPFVMQKSGLIPTIVTLLFLCLFSTFSSMCLTETARLINGIKNNHLNKRFDYNHLINTLISDSVFSNSSKFCVIINHLLYTILCIITLSQTVSIFIIEKFEFISSLINNKLSSDSPMKFGNFLYNFENSIINNENMITMLFLFVIFFICFLIISYRTTKIIFNTFIFVSSFTVVSTLLAYIIVLNLNRNEIHTKNTNKATSTPIIGNDFTYLYGTILFSFSFVSAVPSWTETEELNCNYKSSQKKAFQYSAFIGILFKLIFAISFSTLITFSSEFTMRDFVHTHRNHEDSNLYITLIICLVVFLLLTLMNGIVTHVELLYKSIKTTSDFNFNSFYWIISIFSPWILSLLLLVNGKIFMNLLNWSSIFLFGYVNYILPLILYVEAVNQAEIFENNYKQSAMLDFESFVYLKDAEISCHYKHDEDEVLIPIINPDIKSILSEIKIKKEDDLDIAAKEKVIDLLYENDGYYSIVKSYLNLFGSSIFSKNKISMLFYSIIILLFLFMFFTIYFALYNFFINKTLVVNIFLQINK